VTSAAAGRPCRRAGTRKRSGRQWPNYAPLGRIGTPQDMANATLLLMSDAASSITGIELAVDGGLFMRM